MNFQIGDFVRYMVQDSRNICDVRGEVYAVSHGQLGVKLKGGSRKQNNGNMYLLDEERFFELINRPSQTQFDLLKKEVDSAILEFVKKDMPIKHIGDGAFEFKDGYPLILHPSAATSVRNMTGYQIKNDSGGFKRYYRYSHAEIKEIINTGQWDFLARLINANRKKDTYFVAIIQCGIVGFFKNYNGVYHEDIVSEIKSFGLSDIVKFFDLTHEKLTVNLFLEEDEDRDFFYDMVIENGTNSSTGLRYFLEFGFNDMRLQHKFETGSKRHLSNVSECFEGIQTRLKTLSDINMKQVLEGITAARVLNLMKSTIDKSNSKHVELFEKMSQFTQGWLVINAYEFLMELGRVGGERGWKVVTQKIGQLMLNEMLSI